MRLLLFFLAALTAASAQEGGEVLPPETGPPAAAGTAEPALDLNTEAMRQRITGDAPTELVSLQLGSSDVSLQAAGYWKGEFQVNWGMARSSLGWAAASSDSPVLFTQEADLTLSLRVRDRWFVEANFLDENALNTYRAGYQGFPGEVVQYAGIGNTGLDYPAFSYMDLGGDSPSSFGLYGRFGFRDLTFHTLFRWDAAAREERIFVGNRERTFSYVLLSQALRGRSFVLPDRNIDPGASVYLEDKDGALTDEFGRRWRLAVPSEYGVGALAGQVELNITPPGMVAVAYSRGGAPAPWTISLGAYAGGGFLRQVQDWFDPGFPPAVNLADYPQSGQRPGPSGVGVPGDVRINGIRALVVYEPGAFSPFERLSRYTAPSSNSSAASVVTLSTGERVPGYDIIPLAENAVSSDIPLYVQTEIKREVYELFGTARGTDGGDPAARWPLAGRYPGIYLPGSGEFAGDLGIRFTNYGTAGSYAVGTDVVPGSVQVYRNGLLDSNTTYNAASGEVSLQNPAGLNEVIRITYLKRSDETKMGSVAAGIGAVYDPGGPFSSEFALGLRWNLAQDSYSENGIANPGTVGASVKTTWEFDRLKAHVGGGLAFEQPDTTGLYRIAGMEGNELVLSLPPEDSFVSHPPALASILLTDMPAGSSWTSVPPQLTALESLRLDNQNRASLSYRNYRETSALGTSAIQDITWGSSALVNGQSGPYPARDSALSSRTVSLVAEFSLDASRLWSGFEVPLGDEGKMLERAGALEIPFRFYEFSPTAPANFALILQIGALSEKDAAFAENQALIMQKVLFPASAADTAHSGGQVARFELTDGDRRKLGGAKYLRLIAVHDGSAAAIGGRVVLAPPIVKGAGFKAVLAGADGIRDTAGPGQSVEAVEEAELGGGRLQDRYGSLMGKLHPSGSLQRVLEVKWKGLNSGEGAGADGRIAAIPFVNYRVLSFFIKGPSASSSAPFAGTGDEYFRFIIARGPESLDRAGETTLDVRIPLYHNGNPAQPVFSPGEWSKVELRYAGGNRVTVNGAAVPGASLSYRSPGQVSGAREGDSASGRASYAVFFAGTAGGALPDGRFSLDEIILEDPAPAYRFNGGTALAWNYPGVLLKYRDVEVLSNLSLDTAMEGSARGDPFTSGAEVSGGAVSRSSGGFSLLGAKISGNFAFTAAENTWYWNGGHGISRSFGPLSAEASFSDSPEELSMEHKAALKLSSVVETGLAGEVYYEDGKLDRKWDASLGFDSFGAYIPSFSFETALAWIENTSEPSEWLSSYGKTWVKSWRPLLPDTGAAASKRDTRTRFMLKEEFGPAGAELTLEGSTVFSRPDGSTRSDSLTRLDIPLNLGLYRVLLRGERSYRKDLAYTGADASHEGRKFSENIRDSLHLWKIVPFYSLFAPGAGEAMDRSVRDSASAELTRYALFNDRFDLTLQLPGFYDFRSLYVPGTAGARVERVLEQKLDTRLDMLNLSGNLGFSSVNMFGAFGMRPLFNFYQSDEFNHSLEAAAAFPKNEEPSWRIQSGITLSFYGFSGGEMGFGNTVTAADSGWIESATLEWIVPTRRSLLSIFYGFIARAVRTQSSWLTLSRLLDADFEQLRKETMELVADFSGEYPQWSLILGHESIIRILGQLNFSVFAKLNCGENRQTGILSILGTLGTTLNVSF
ncbi:MAG: hypothetical protein LBS06_07715 [Treponema sp.]|nr:hypothetical protein [Treponema sp.]